jgi:excisionase family DNA binding protein
MGKGRPNTAGTEQLLTATEVAAEFGVSKTTVYKWGRERRLDVHMLGDGKIWRTTRASVDGLRNGTRRAAISRNGRL